ncbi:MAG: hypothetical protein Q9227_008826 [Pyrenula ochraceoflavens]
MDRARPVLEVFSRKGNKFRHLIGKKLKPSNKDVTAFLQKQDGTAHPALDFRPNSGVEISQDEEAVVITAGDTEKSEAQVEELYNCLSKSSLTLAGDYSNPTRSAIVATPDMVEADVVRAVNSLNNVTGARQERLHQRDFFGKLHKVFSGFRKHAIDARSFIALLPQGCEFGSLICGGLSIVLKAAGEYARMETSMVDALERICSVMVEKAYIEKIHPEDPYLHTLVSSLFASIFAVLEILAQWIFKLPIRRAAEALLSPQTYCQELKFCVSRMEQKANSVRNRAAFLERKITKQQLDTVKKIYSEIQDLKSTSDDTNNKVEIVMSQYNTLDLILQRANITSKLYTMITSDPPRQLALQRKSNGVRPIFTFFPGDKVGKERRHRCITSLTLLRFAGRKNQQAELLTPLSSSFQRGQAQIDAEDVLHAVGYQRDLITKDCRAILAGWRSGDIEHDKATKLCSDVRMKTFMETRYSHVLLIEGIPWSRHQTRSATSLLSARIVDTLSQVDCSSDGFYAVSYFCSEHHQQQEAFSSVQDLLITWVLQLIEQHKDFDETHLKACQDLILSGLTEIELLWDLFEGCIRHLPQESRLFCILDGIGFFETPKKRRVSMELVIRRLLELGRERDPGSATIKLLFTTPARCAHFRKLFEPHEVFSGVKTFS